VSEPVDGTAGAYASYSYENQLWHLHLILAAESDEKGRSIAETLVYALLILSAVASIISAAAQSVVVPSRVALNNCKTEYCA
jgi:hypothetical protein